MFLRSFTGNSAVNPKTSLAFTLVLGLVIYGYFYFNDKLTKNRYPYFKLKENRILLVERDKGGQKDTVSWLCRRVNIWRYYGTNLGLYAEKADSLITEFQPGRYYLTAIYRKIPYYDLFDRSGQQYGISILPAQLTDSSSWNDEHLGFEHRVIKRDTLLYNNRKIGCLVIETRMSRQAAEVITGKLHSRFAEQLSDFEQIRNQSWLNWYSLEYGWLQTVCPDGSRERVVLIEDIYWFERIFRFFDFGVKG